MPQAKSQPIGHCIYCGADGTKVKLTDEHAIPFALNGWVVLTKASCEPCARITGSIEQRCLRGSFLEARTQLNMQTRRPKERPKTFRSVLKTPDGPVENEVPVDVSPFVLRLPNLAAPPILSGKTGGEWVEHIALRQGPTSKPSPFWTFVGATNAQQLETANHLYSKLLVYEPTLFALFLAKIAHCCAVAYKGPQGFEPLLPKLIISKSPTVSDFVGGCAKPIDEVRDHSSHVFVNSGREWVRVEICLFANLGAPYYQVVAGRSKAP